jgi:hypothetical protein
MNQKKTIEYTETVKGYMIDKTDDGCARYPHCISCPFEDCYPTEDAEKKAKRKEQMKKAAKTYRDKNKEKIKEKNRLWREKQRLVRLLDQKRQDAEEKAITPLMS